MYIIPGRNRQSVRQHHVWHGWRLGTSQRVFGALLTWMQEKTAPVFVVMTANSAEVLPAELIRKGRIDEIFWVDLPNLTEAGGNFSSSPHPRPS